MESKPATQEEEYFRKRERELIEKIRLRSQAESERKGLAEALGVSDGAILADLQSLGFNRDTVSLLHLVPLLQVAWIDGEVTRAEARKIFDAARLRGVLKGSPAYRLLEEWMQKRPSPEFFDHSLRVIRDLLGLLPEDQRSGGVRGLVSCCTEIAAASGGLLGMGSRISNVEREALTRIALELEADHAGAARGVVEGIYGAQAG